LEGGGGEVKEIVISTPWAESAQLRDATLRRSRLKKQQETAAAEQLPAV